MDREAECEIARATEPVVPPATPVTPRDGEGGTGRPARTALRTEDGVRIEAEYLPYTGDRQPPPEERPGEGEGGHGPPVNGAIVLAHGFTGSLEKPALRRAAETFSQHAPVIAFSFRGHGGSGGLSTLGDREVLDLAAAVRWARSLGHDRIATVGFSMGGSVVLRHGGLYRRPESPDTGGTAGKSCGDGVCSPTQAKHRGGTDSDTAFTAFTARSGSADSGPAAGSAPEHAAHPDAVIAISAPARWYYRGTAPMRRLHWVVERPVGRMVGRYGLRTRIHSRSWDPVPLSPVGAVPLIAPAPLLIVHGDLDAYFPLDHPRSLAEAAGPEGAELWLERGFGHAENAAGPALLHRIGAWARARCLALPPARHHGTRNADG